MDAEEAKNELEKIKSSLEISIPFIKIFLDRKKPKPEKINPISNIFERYYSDSFEKFGSVLYTIKISASVSSLNCSRYTIQDAIEKYKIAFDIILALKQGIQLKNKKNSMKKLLEFYSQLLILLREITIENSLKIFDPKSVKYTEQEVSEKIEKSNIDRINQRIHFYKQLDPNFQKLQNNLTQTNSSEQLDSSFAKLLYLAGFDCEIFSSIQADIDIIGIDILKKAILLIETTTGPINKKKVAQLTVRKAEYAKKNYDFTNKPEIKLILVSSKTESIDKLALKEGKNNSVSIIENKQLMELLKMVTDGTLNQEEFLNYIKNYVPK